MKTKWDAIVKAHCHTPNWEDEGGVQHAEVRGLSWKALDTCKRQWLLSIFTQDAAEIERCYLEHYIIHPNKMTIQAFLERLVQLNNYLPLLPCLADDKDMPKTISPMNVSFTEQELATILLHSMKDKYIRMFDTVQDKPFPLFVKDTVTKLERIKNLFMDDEKRKWQVQALHEAAGENNASNNKLTGKRFSSAKSGPCKKMRNEKYCQ